MASGIPVIVNDIRAFRNFIENGKNGFMVDFSEPDKVAEKITKIMNVDLSKLIENGKNKAKEYAFYKI